MPFNTSNPIPSGDLRDLDDNARNIDTWANDKTKLSHPDRFGVERRTWHGIEQEAKLNIQQAIDAKNAAQEAAMMSGFSKYADTLAQLEAGIGTDYVDGDVVLVFQDESRGGTSSIYKVESGVAVFKNAFDKTRQDLLSFTGSISADAEWSDVPAHSDPAFDAQAQALADRTEILMNGVGGYSNIREYTGNGARLKVQDPTGAHWWVRRGSAADNGGTVLVDALGRSWEREFIGAVETRWFGVTGSNDAEKLMRANAAAAARKTSLSITSVIDVEVATVITVPLVDGLTQIFTASSLVTIENSLPVRPEWFDNDMSRALSAVPESGGTLLLSDAVYPPFAAPVRRNNISIIGTKLPKFKADFTGLEGGSIIQGPFDFRGDDITLENFGVDSGSAVCASLYGGIAQEGFLSGLPVSTRSKRLHASKLVAICKSPTALVHGFAFEGYTDSEIHEIEAVYGVHGIAIKATDSNVSSLKARGCAYDGVIIKSDTSETTSERLNVNGIVCGSIGAYDGAGLRITNSVGNQVLVGINIKNVVCNRTVYGIDFDCNDSHLIDSVNIDGAFFFVCQTYGFRNRGMARRCKVSNAVAYNCGTQGFLTAKAIGAGSGDGQSEIDFDSCTASNCATGFELHGRNKISKCWSGHNTYYGFYAAPGSRVSRVSCVATGNGTAEYGPEEAIWYPGNSALEAVVATLQNGWENYGAGSETASFYITDDGIVYLSGLVTLGTVGLPIFQLPVGYRPKKELWFLCSSLNGATLAPAHVVVAADGTVVAQHGAGNAFISLDGISFRIDLT